MMAGGEKGGEERKKKGAPAKERGGRRTWEKICASRGEQESAKKKRAGTRGKSARDGDRKKGTSDPPVELRRKGGNENQRWREKRGGCRPPKKGIAPRKKGRALQRGRRKETHGEKKKGESPREKGGSPHQTLVWKKKKVKTKGCRGGDSTQVTDRKGGGAQLCYGGGMSGQPIAIA